MGSATKRAIINQSRRMLLETDMQIGEIAKELYISEVYLRKIYNAVFHASPKVYIKRVKMKKAQTLLRITDQTVTQVANELGYTNVSKFSKQFYREFQQSPSKYKQSIKK